MRMNTPRRETSTDTCSFHLELWLIHTRKEIGWRV